MLFERFLQQWNPRRLNETRRLFRSGAYSRKYLRKIFTWTEMMTFTCEVHAFMPVIHKALKTELLLLKCPVDALHMIKQQYNKYGCKQCLPHTLFLPARLKVRLWGKSRLHKRSFYLKSAPSFLPLPHTNKRTNTIRHDDQQNIPFVYHYSRKFLLVQNILLEENIIHVVLIFMSSRVFSFYASIDQLHWVCYNITLLYGCR